MITQALLPLKAIATGIWILSMLAGFSSIALAETKSAPQKPQHGDLVLTLSDDQLMTETGKGSRPLYEHESGSDMAHHKPVDVGCGMDLSPFSSTNDKENSLSNRLVGECNFNYKY